MAGSSARAKSRAAERSSSWSGVSLKSMLLSGGVRHASSQKFRLFDKVGERGHETAAIGSVDRAVIARSEEHTSELQSLMRISYAVFCLKKKKKHNNNKLQHTVPNDTLVPMLYTTHIKNK